MGRGAACRRSPHAAPSGGTLGAMTTPNLPDATTRLGFVLTCLGVFCFLLTDAPTALIPAAFGGAFWVLGEAAKRPGLRPAAMHTVALLCLVGAVLGLGMGLRGEPGMASAEQLALGTLCAAHLWACIQSFRAARRREAGPT